jgi:hypothetical protein
MASRPSFPGNLVTGPKYFLLHDCETGQQIVSGHPTVFETDVIGCITYYPLGRGQDIEVHIQRKN